MQRIRDNPKCAAEEFGIAADAADRGMNFRMTYEPDAEPTVTLSMPPRIAILREQGINGHVEMAAAFREAGCESVDVHMTDLHGGRASLADFDGLVACGGFSYGDVLGSGTGWAESILQSERLSEMFADFFARKGTLALGVCNGCQMISQLKPLIPGAEDWPIFVHNESEQFEARYATVEITESPSVFLRGMAGSILPIAVAHGDGRAAFATPAEREATIANGLVAMRYVDNNGAPTDRYPWNPNGTKGGLTGFTTPDGRVTIMMPHPERGFRALQLSYRPANFCAGEAGPWMKMFRNAYDFLVK
jgi:phosphoribosylformylglycinamidine synthase